MGKNPEAEKPDTSMERSAQIEMTTLRDFTQKQPQEKEKKGKTLEKNRR